MSETIVEAVNLTREFIRGQTKVTALDHVDISVLRGEFVR